MKKKFLTKKKSAEEENSDAAENFNEGEISDVKKF